MSGPSLPRLLLLTDRAQLAKGRGLSATVAECAAAGLEAVVVREHDLDRRGFAALVDTLLAVPGLRVLTSRRAHPGAAGLHLAAHQPAPATGVFGRSCHDAAGLAAAAAEGAAWATVSPYAATASKPGHGPPLDPALLGRDHGLPVWALGGLDPTNAAGALGAGAAGVAVMGAVMRARDPAQVVADLLAATAPAVTR
ncbi:thiamine-phosphate pyrophosphorylase [Nocardioides dokdonensis FR1436]|uniref:Thiamine-phosphate pyrophosphorylase n=1 Tax=Nocardioides dokdonensis FR1436 TaxID=1300347 RepID=A0A1A9GJN3_9ACTN|nr:thiamine phosphate synthase [Nocardioides dokdonensis]ANH38478.1 thiamine-phosphate pyrophosphorylase [Nocardioides dokdonensis FR1436]